MILGVSFFCLAPPEVRLLRLLLRSLRSVPWLWPVLVLQLLLTFPCHTILTSAIVIERLAPSGLVPRWHCIRWFKLTCSRHTIYTPLSRYRGNLPELGSTRYLSTYVSAFNKLGLATVLDLSSFLFIAIISFTLYARWPLCRRWGFFENYRRCMKT